MECTSSCRSFCLSLSVRILSSRTTLGVHCTRGQRPVCYQGSGLTSHTLVCKLIVGYTRPPKLGYGAPERGMLFLIEGKNKFTFVAANLTGTRRSFCFDLPFLADKMAIDKTLGFASTTPPQTSSDVKDPITQLEDTSPDDHDTPRPEDQNLVYADDEHEPELHARTWLAIAGFCLWSFTQLFALLGPPTVLGIIAEDLDGVNDAAWIVNMFVLVQAALVNPLATASDLFQARKSFVLACCTLAFIGATMAPGSQSVGRLIGAQTFIGFGNAMQVLAFTVPSEILPKRWRPLAQAIILTTGALGMVVAPITMGNFVQQSVGNWRNFYWIETGLWGATGLFILLFYRPPKRHTRLDHLGFFQKLLKIDLLGTFILTAGLVLLLTGLSMGGPAHPWTSAETLSTLIIGGVLLIVFVVYEWKGTKTGILHHELFNHDKKGVRTFVICLILVFLESPMLYTLILEYPLLTNVLFEQNILLSSARLALCYGFIGVGYALFGWLAARYRSIREVMMVGFALYVVSNIGMITVKPGQSNSAMAFSALQGFGLGAILGQVTAGVQIVSPHAHLATSTALALSIRAAATTACVPIYNAVVNSGLASRLPRYVMRAAISGGLPESSIPAFVQALATSQPALLSDIPGLTEATKAAGQLAVQQAYADSIRITYIIALPFGVAGLVLCWWVGDLKKFMTWHVDAPVEKLTAKVDKHHEKYVGTEA